MSNKRPGARALPWVLLAVSVAAGCVVVEEPARTTEARQDPVYRTGTRLPTTGGQPVGAMSQEEWNRSSMNPNVNRVEVGNKAGN